MRCKKFLSSSAYRSFSQLAHRKCRPERIRGHYVRTEAVGAASGPMTADRGRHLAEPPGPSSFRRVNPPLAPANADASRRKPTPARPCTVARVVTNRTTRSDQAIALRRRSARRCRIDGLHRTGPIRTGERGGTTLRQLGVVLAWPAGILGEVQCDDGSSA